MQKGKITGNSCDKFGLHVYVKYIECIFAIKTVPWAKEILKC